MRWSQVADAMVNIDQAVRTSAAGMGQIRGVIRELLGLTDEMAGTLAALSDEGAAARAAA